MTDEQIKQNAEEYADSMKYTNGEPEWCADRDEEINALHDLLDVYERELDKLRNPWISVNDRLPEKLNKFFSDFVLVVYTRGGKSYPFITRYDYEYGMWEIENVTHWMPIPELKKGGEL